MTLADPILEQLNPAQREAVTTTEGPLLVIAGAGSGKTRVITHRIAYLVGSQGVEPWEIFAATFTNKAAEEMKHRIETLLPGFQSARLSIGTFHSICVSILRREAGRVGLAPRFTIADATDQKALVKACIRDLEIPGSAVQPEGALNWISMAKTKMYTPEEAGRSLENEWGQDYPRIYALYEEQLAKNQAVDFDDLLLKVVRLFQQEAEVLASYQDRWKHYLIDEYQDINQVQFELVRLLAGRDRNLCAVGDDDQSIYSWRGADIKNILDFEETFEGTKKVRLEQNYRSTETILKAANAVISRNIDRMGKELKCDRGAGEPLTLIVGNSEREEAALVVDTIVWLKRLLGARYRDAAIFYRVNALSRLFEDFLRQAQVPYRVVGGIRFYDRAEIKDLLAYMRLIANPFDGLSLGRIINKPRRGIGKKTIGKIEAAANRKGITLWEQLPESIQDEELPKKARAGIADLVRMINLWRGMSENRSPTELLDEVLHETNYREKLGDPHALETLTREENIEELHRAVEEFTAESPDAGLDDYLDRVTLATSVDEMDAEGECVSLMTLHTAKGLEFRYVFITGLEEGIFPSPRALEAGTLEEERRLFYVGVTRARDRLFLSRADSRNLYGRTQFNPPSSFLSEVPEELTQTLEDSRGAWNEENREAARSVMLGERAGAATLADASAGEAVTDDGETGIFALGARVKHAKLGEGEVTAVRGRGAKRKVSIRFDAGLELEVLEQYGGLEAVEDLPF